MAKAWLDMIRKLAIQNGLPAVVSIGRDRVSTGIDAKEALLSSQFLSSQKIWQPFVSVG